MDTENPDKNLDDLDIPLPKLTRRFQRDFKDLDALDAAALGNRRLPLKPFTPEETREIVFKTMLDSEIHHTINWTAQGLPTSAPSWRSLRANCSKIYVSLAAMTCSMGK